MDREKVIATTAFGFYLTQKWIEDSIRASLLLGSRFGGRELSVEVKRDQIVVELSLLNSEDSESDYIHLCEKCIKYIRVGVNGVFPNMPHVRIIKHVEWEIWSDAEIL